MTAAIDREVVVVIESGCGAESQSVGHLVPVFRRSADSREAGSVGFENRPGLEQERELFDFDPADEHAAPRDDGHEMFALEAQQRFSNWGTTELQ